MTTDRTVTPADIDAYNARRARLRAKGIADIPDLYGQDEVGGRFDPNGLVRFLAPARQRDRRGHRGRTCRERR